MQLINLVRWLQDVVEGLGGTTFVARQELVREPDIKYLFDIDGTRTGSILDDTHGFNRRSGWEAPIWTTYVRLAVEACLEQLKNHEYFVPDFSYF